MKADQIADGMNRNAEQQPQDATAADKHDAGQHAVEDNGIITDPPHHRGARQPGKKRIRGCRHD